MFVGKLISLLKDLVFDIEQEIEQIAATLLIWLTAWSHSHFYRIILSTTLAPQEIIENIIYVAEGTVQYRNRHENSDRSHKRYLLACFPQSARRGTQTKEKTVTKSCKRKCMSSIFQEWLPKVSAKPTRYENSKQFRNSDTKTLHRPFNQK